MSSLWKKAASICGYLVRSVSQMRATLETSQSAGWVSRTSMPGLFLTTALKPRARPCPPVWPRAPWVMVIVPLPPSLETSAFGDRRAHELVIGGEEGVDVDLIE